MEALANMEIPAVGDLAAMARSLPVTYGDVFNLCHMIVSVLSVRKDAGKQFGISNPVAAWASSIITVFAGSLVANPLLGKRRFFCSVEVLPGCRGQNSTKTPFYRRPFQMEV